MSSETAQINNFPSEILLHIFSFLSTPDLILCVTKVCTRWNALTQNLKLWHCREVEIPEDDSVQALVKCLPKCSSVNVILDTITRPGKALIYKTRLHAYIRTRYYFLTFLSTLIDNGENITELTVSGANKEVVKVMAISSHLPNLQALVMRGSYPVERSGIRYLADHCPHLKKVDIEGYFFLLQEMKYFLNKKKHQLTHIGLPLDIVKGSLLPYLAICGDTLISLDIHGLGVFLSSFVCDMSVFSALKKLEHLTFHHILKFGNGVLAKAFTAGWFLNLRTLTMYAGSYVDDEVVAAICLNCPLLRDLKINESEIAGEGLKYLHCLQNLQTLDLSLSDFLESLGTLSQCVQLQHLNLGHCRGVSPREIADAVPCISELRHLDLTFCDVSQLCLHGLPQRLPLLRNFLLCHTDVDEEQVETMRLCAPHIDVLI